MAPEGRAIVPQANDLGKILSFPDAVAEGHDTKDDWAEHQGIQPRQADYYSEAVQALGLIRVESGSYSLTWEGMIFRTLSDKAKRGFIVARMLEVPVVRAALNHPGAREEPGLTTADLEAVIVENSDLSGSTLERRAQTLRAWLKWLGTETGAIREVSSGIFVGI